MVTQFNTAGASSSASAPATTGSGKGGNTLLIVAGIGIAAFLAWEFWWKPMQAKKKLEEK